MVAALQLPSSWCVTNPLSPARLLLINTLPSLTDTAGDWGHTATVYNDFLPAPIQALTALPYTVTGEKIPDGLGMRVADSKTYK